MFQRRLLGGLLLCMLCLPWGCGEKIEPGTTAQKSQEAVKVSVAVAAVTQRPLFYEAMGTVKARTASTLSSKLLGTVKKVFVREGDRVNQGDLLVVLDGRQVTAQLRQAQEALAQAGRTEAAARAGADLAQATYQRYLLLAKQESVSRQEFDEIEARQRQAEAMASAAGHGVQQAEAAVAAAQVSLQDASVRAPYDGIVTAKMVEPGDLAAAGTPLVSLEKTGAFRVELVIPETHVHFVSLDRKVMIRVPSLSIPSLEGTVTTIAPAADQHSRSFLVKVDLPADPAVRSGMFARVTIPMAPEGLLLIPAAALIVQGQLTGIFVVDADQIARFRLIRTGRTFGDSVEVISGLSAGIRYVASPVPRLVDGARVEVGS
ncbi:MAG: efflux RND transporter periplasmic adaptor subunit [Pseudomonadota bacterium]|uniref:Efflux RND transporter periplasmic adaptor subunit n=1 Tax=Candidatus Desulfatibia profunda TaxID=2841695 RepID=A0A8J6NTI3_9BACT|nr:efflux RND transporter periplasmic adaptor subunit [Candidatus Desulfatibia profunda]